MWPFGQRILSPPRLPTPPPGLGVTIPPRERIRRRVGRLERGAVQDVALGDGQALGSPGGAISSARIAVPATIVDARSGISPRTWRRSSSGSAASRSSCAATASADSSCPSTRSGISSSSPRSIVASVVIGARHADQGAGRHVAGQHLRHLAPQRRDLARRWAGRCAGAARYIRTQPMSRLTAKPTPSILAGDQLGAAAADVADDHGCRPAAVPRRRRAASAAPPARRSAPGCARRSAAPDGAGTRRRWPRRGRRWSPSPAASRRRSSRARSA